MLKQIKCWGNIQDFQKFLGNKRNLRAYKYIQDFVNDKYKGCALSILDAGCGTGRTYESLSSLDIELGYHGFDITKQFIFYCKKQYPNVRFECLDIYQAELPAKRYDLTIVKGLLEHLPSYKVPIDKLIDATRHQILIITSTPFNSSQKDRIRIEDGQWGKYYKNSFSLPEFRGYVSKKIRNISIDDKSLKPFQIIILGVDDK